MASEEYYIQWADEDYVETETHPVGFESWEDYHRQADALEDKCKDNY